MSSYFGLFSEFCSSMNAEINERDHGAYTRLVNVCVFPVDFLLDVL